MSETPDAWSLDGKPEFRDQFPRQSPPPATDKLRAPRAPGSFSSRQIPTQVQVEKMLNAIESSVADLRKMWLWVASNSYERPRHRGMEINPATAKPPEDHQMKPRGQGPGSGAEDPVGDIVAATERIRRHIRHAGREIQDAANRLGTAVWDLGEAEKLLDPPPGPEVADVRLLPHPAGARDVLQAQAAQARRLRRAEKSGDYGEVTG